MIHPFQCQIVTRDSAPANGSNAGPESFSKFPRIERSRQAPGRDLAAEAQRPLVLHTVDFQVFGKR